MKTIAIESGLSTGLSQDFRAITCLEIEGAPLGQGGFGAVYRSQNGQVIKLLIDNDDGIARRGYETVRELQRRLCLKNAELLQTTGRSLLDHFPALQGVPQFSFEGILEGRRVIGYSANDLTQAGFEDFGRILDTDAEVRRFQALPLTDRMRIASQLVGAFDFLSSQALFIHADIKAEALFVDLKRSACAIIDFDSGALARDANDRPTTFGTKQDWLAPEIVQQLDRKDNASRVIKVDLLSDIWSVNIAVHYLLFGFHPLFFLSEISDRSIAAYFQSCQWPDVTPGFPYFQQAYADIYRRYVTLLHNDLPQDLLQRFAFTINKGYRDPASRTTYGQWKTVLGSLNRPEIKSFAVDRTLVADFRPVRLSWNVRGAARLEITGVGDVTRLASIEVPVRKDTEFTLLLTPHEGAPLRETLLVAVSKDPPRIERFKSSHVFVRQGMETEIHWKVRNASEVRIEPRIGVVPLEGSRRICVDGEEQFVISAVSFFGYQATARLSIRVLKTTALSVKHLTPLATGTTL